MVVDYKFIIPFILMTVLAVGMPIVGGLRFRAVGFDAFLALCVFLWIQCVAPLALICGTLSFTTAHGDNDNPLFARLYASLSGSDALLVCSMCWVFIFCTYATYSSAVRRISTTANIEKRPLVLVINRRRHFIITIMGLASGIGLVYLLGPTIASGYKALIRFRNGDVEIQRTFATANLFSLTQAFLLVGFLGPFLGRRGPRPQIWRAGWIATIMGLALVCVSRRSIMIPLLLTILTWLTLGKRVRIAYLTIIFILGTVTMYYGKQVLYHIYSGSDEITHLDLTPSEDVLYVTSDIGITVTESLATLSFLHLPPRYGIDHLLSVARRVPDGALGLDLGFPERIVRISTAAFVGPDEQDIPPGLFGQMWLDFRFAGPFVYGIFVGLGLALVEHVRRRIVMTSQAAALCSVVYFVIFLPVNSGSLDFDCSIDMIFLVLLLALIVRVRPAPLRQREVSRSNINANTVRHRFA